MTKYSIVITTYNAEKFLEECLDSVFNQTYKNWELILVNDGSNDNSGNIAKKFADKVNVFVEANNEYKPEVIYLEHDNRGAVYSRERGIIATSGDYILFMDADDYWDADLLEKVDKVISETGSDIVQYGYRFKSEDGKDALDAGLSKKGASEFGIVTDDDNNSFSYNSLRISYSLWSRAFKSELFNKEAGFLEQYYDVNMTNDLLALSWPLSQAKTYCLADFYAYNYRIVGSSLCHDISIKKICSYFRSFGWAERCLRERNGESNEHMAFFSDRLSNIIFDEYRENIYTSSVADIKKVYEAAAEIYNIDTYLKMCIEKSNNWYKTAYLKSFLKRRIIIPKLLYYYSVIRNK